MGPQLFNPYQFFGIRQMWPRGFPTTRLQNHTNGNEQMYLCHKMRSAAVQQGLVHNDPDVDAIFGLLHADKKTGLNEEFNRITPPIVLEAGQLICHLLRHWAIYEPILLSILKTHFFIVQLFFTLFLPITVTSRDLYMKADAMLELLDKWECKHEEISECVVRLAEKFRERNFWGSADVEAIRKWISDLKKIGYQFPPRVNQDYYGVSDNVTTRGHNCRRINLEFEAPYDDLELELTKKSTEKLNALGDIADWCAEANYTGRFLEDLFNKMPSSSQLANLHANNEVLKNLSESVLIITNNYPWNHTIGLLQRMYQPYFGFTIFCGTWFPDKYSNEHFPPMISPFNYINLSIEEMHKGYFAYYCLVKVKDMKLGQVKGKTCGARFEFRGLFTEIARVLRYGG
ncbi:hypothetical protein ANCCAN_05693 [Ancylostoma caninum]|uniref:Uncharacterized protein n=1 Tax=Ancylostoma caninum TaxID=29170 RepID=A0A368GXH3_ANCCA|nr:hypothetical protein ANCCAN_05693 [Ancylostoma caninum]